MLYNGVKVLLCCTLVIGKEGTVGTVGTALGRSTFLNYNIIKSLLNRRYLLFFKVALKIVL